MASSCSKNTGSGGNQSGSNTNITATVSSTTVNRQKSNANARFFVDLSKAASVPVSVSYSTQDSTAKSGTDYVSASGTLTIPAGSTEGYFDIVVLGDSLRQNPQVFKVVLSNPVQCKLSGTAAAATIINDGTYLPVDPSGYTTPNSYPGYTLAWSDEFNDTALNANNWNYESGGSGWGNQELENYTSRVQNLFLSSGMLIIEARQESYGSNNYTSARIDTKGKETPTYGRIDIRAKLPVSKGMWPALWMLGTNIDQVSWPGCGETDIMELIGTNPSQVVGSFHWLQSNGQEGTYNNTINLSGTDFSKQFHVFSLIWAKDTAQLLMDDQVYVSETHVNNITSGTYPFNSPFFFIFNVAVGGNWPGPPDASTVFPQRMFVDYVRVFQKN